MESRSRSISVALVVVLISCFFSYLGTAIDTITASQPIRDAETIISNGSAFKLGFFSPNKNSSNRYVGIWFNDNSETVIWVANRNKPLNDPSGVVTISEDGAAVLNGQKEVLWSSNVSNSVTNVSAQLLDTGNLVPRDITTGISIWESFQEPTDTFLPGMKLSSNVRTGPLQQLRSWKSPSDPSPGNFSLGINPSNIPEVFIWNDTRAYWRTGPWNGQVFIGLYDISSAYIDGFQLLQDDNGYFNFTYLVSKNKPSFFFLSSQGILERRNWIDEKKKKIGRLFISPSILSVMFMAGVGHLETVIHRKSQSAVV